MRIILLLAALGFCGAITVDAVQLSSDLLDASHDQVLERIVVPSLEKPQGEVQLIRRDQFLVVQTLLASPVLRQVVAAIDAKEERQWPETHQGYVDSNRYREELFRATQEVWRQFRQRSDKSEIRQYLAIEFILGHDRGTIALSVPQVEGAYGALKLVGKNNLAVWRSSNVYVTENIRQIVRDSFSLDAVAAENLLEPLWPSRP